LNIADEVEIIQGTLKGLKGTIVQLHNGNYVQIQLQSLHQSIKVKLPAHILQTASLN
jgi:transcription antitermination factor NusG